MLHFTMDEYAARLVKIRAEMERRGLNAMLLFAPESQFWATGYDTFGYCFFQCLVIDGKGEALLTRSADLRQAQLTSTVKDIRIWKDEAGADPTADLAKLLAERGLAQGKLGIETDTQGLTARWGKAMEARFDNLVEASDLMPRLRLVKSEAEIAFSRKAGEIGDAAYLKALDLVGPGADEAAIWPRFRGRFLPLAGIMPGMNLSSAPVIMLSSAVINPGGGSWKRGISLPSNGPVSGGIIMRR